MLQMDIIIIQKVQVLLKNTTTDQILTMETVLLQATSSVLRLIWIMEQSLSIKMV